MARTDTGDALDHLGIPVLAIDRDWRIGYLNPAAESALGALAAAATGRPLWSISPGLATATIRARLEAAMRDREPTQLEARVDDGRTWLDVHAEPTETGLLVWFSDITARHNSRQAVERETEQATELVHLSALIGERLSHSLYLADGVRELAHLVVPRLADWSIVSVIEPDGRIRDLSTWHVDPDMRATVDQFAGARFENRDGHGPIGEAVRSRAPVITRSRVTELALAAVQQPAAREAIRILAPTSSAAVPLIAGDDVVGALSLVRGADRPPMSDDEITVAVSIARRAAMALVNARLFAQQRETAERLSEANRLLAEAADRDRTIARALQDAMLTRLPHPDGLRLAARYLPATGDADVGGDWYDAIVAPSGTTTLMIGDVAGHDIAAAAIMGQLRNLLRGFAWDRDEDRPAQLADRLDRAIRDLHLNTAATLALVRIDPSAGDGSPRVVRWTTAGHPAPVLIDPAGAVELLDGWPNLLLGVAPELPRTDQTMLVPDGSTLLLYTDCSTPTDW